LAHLQTAGIAFQLREQIEARQGRAELGAQPVADLGLHQVGTRQQAQPQPEGLMMIVGEPRLEIHPLGRTRRGTKLLRLHWPSPPATTMACPVTAPAPGRHSQSTALATSSGRTSRCCGFARVSAARASPSLLPVVRTMFEIAAATMSVSVYPGHTALTVTSERAVSSASARVRPITPCLAAQYADTYP